MRILQVTSHLEVGGISTSVVNLAQGLVRRGHEVTIASEGGALAPQAREAGIRLWDVPLKTSSELSLRVVRAGRRLRDRLERQPVDVLHAHTRVSQVVAHRLSRRLGIPHVATWHGVYRRRLGRRLWPCAGALTIAISEPVAAKVARDFHVPRERIRVIPHGVLLSRFEEEVPPEGSARLREALGLRQDDPVVGTVSRLAREKPLWQLLEAFAELRTMMPYARLLIVGGGPERPRLEHLAAHLGVTHAVRFAGTLTETRTALSIMGVFAFLPAPEEGFGLTLLEAMAAGRPIVAVQGGGGSKWLLEEVQEGAVVVEARQKAKLAEALRRVLEDRGLAQRLVTAARAIVQSRFSLEREVEQVERAYRECLGAS